jgi:acyl carrier protein
MTDIARLLRKLVSTTLAVDEAKVVAEASFVQDLGADSLGIVELSMAVEREFGIKISDDAVEALRTVGEAERYIKSRR